MYQLNIKAYQSIWFHIDIKFIKWFLHFQFPKQRDVRTHLNLEEKYTSNPGPGQYK